MGRVRSLRRVRRRRGRALARCRARGRVWRLAGSAARRRAGERHRSGRRARPGARRAGPLRRLHDGEGEGRRDRADARRRRRSGRRRARCPRTRGARPGRRQRRAGTSSRPRRRSRGSRHTTSSTPSSPAPPSRSWPICGPPWPARESMCRSPPTSRSARRTTRSVSRGCGAADIVVVKVAPLGGVERALEIVEACGLPAVVSSALDTSVGIAAGVALAAALPTLEHACGLGTVGLFERDVATAPLRPAGGLLSPVATGPRRDRPRRARCGAGPAALVARSSRPLPRRARCTTGRSRDQGLSQRRPHSGGPPRCAADARRARSGGGRRRGRPAPSWCTCTPATTPVARPS